MAHEESNGRNGGRTSYFRTPSMVPRKKQPSGHKPRANPETKTEREQREQGEKSESTKVEIGWGSLKASLDMQKHGVVLVYAIAFAVGFGTVGLIVVQVIKALNGTGVTLPAITGFITWTFTACTSAFLLRLSP